MTQRFFHRDLRVFRNGGADFCRGILPDHDSAGGTSKHHMLSCFTFLRNYEESGYFPDAATLLSSETLSPALCLSCGMLPMQRGQVRAPLDSPLFAKVGWMPVSC